MGRPCMMPNSVRGAAPASRMVTALGQRAPGLALPVWRGRLAVLLGVVMALPAGVASAQDAITARVATFGEVGAGRDLGIKDPATVEGNGTVKLWQDTRIVRRTGRIEARLCMRFGVQFVVEGIPPGGTVDVTVASSHPRLVGPDGRGGTGVRYPRPVASGQPMLIGYTFDHPWELVPGTWSFALRLGDRMLAEQAIEVVAAPDGGMAMQGDCSAPIS